MVPPEAQYPDVYTDTFIFFLRSLCRIILMNVHYFPNAPRILIESADGKPGPHWPRFQNLDANHSQVYLIMLVERWNS